MSTLACHALSVRIGDVLVAEDLQLAIRPGQFWGLLGPNGIGKTTLLKCMAGLTPPDSGLVLLENQSMAKLPRRAVDRGRDILQ